MNVKAVLPSRGLVHSRAIEGVLQNIAGTDIVFVHSLPMPDCFNVGVRTALDSGATHIWLVEEDNQQPEGVLEALLSCKADIATLDYPTAGGSHIYQKDGEILWCGLGSTLIRREVFEAIPEPWFEVDKHLNFRGSGFEILQLSPEKVGSSWGCHDALFFYTKCRPLGFKIKALTGLRGKHYRCKELPKIERNNGSYTIYSL